MSHTHIDPDHLKLNQGEELDSILICSICQGFIVNPQECKLCQRSFCSFCINKWKNNSSICPNLCKNPLYVNSHLVIRNNLDKLRFRCCNESCGAVLSYADKVNGKHENSCLVSNDSAFLKLKDKNSFAITCSFCNLKTTLLEFSTHEKECAEKTRKDKELVEVCNLCQNATDKYEQCSKCNKLYCDSRCLGKCNKCSELFCLKDCSRICYCTRNSHCNSCLTGIEETEITCVICKGSQKLICELCKEKSNCTECNKQVCINCTMFCIKCNGTKCLDCLWNCNDCNFKKCACDPKFNGFFYSIVAILCCFYYFLKPKEFSNWNIFFKVLYVTWASIFVIPLLILILLSYGLITVILLEFSQKICLACKEESYEY